MTRGGRPDRVHPKCAVLAISKAKDDMHAWSEYVRIYFRSTGKLAPGCDARDFYAWWEGYNGRQLIREEQGGSADATH